MTSWKKVVCTLRFVVHEIDLHRPMMGNYICKWEIESEKGETDSTKPNNRDKLEFDSSFEHSLTFYMNQKDSSIRPKKLKLLLKRLKDNDREKIYGKLIIDIAKFYQKKDSTNTVIRDMESGRSIAPTFNGSFNLYLKDEGNQEIINNNIDDPLFKIDPDTEISLSDWDVSLIGDEEDDKNNNNEIKQNNKNKSQTLAEDAEIVKETEEAEKKNFYQIVKIYAKQNAIERNVNEPLNIPAGEKSNISSSVSADLSEEEFEKDKEINSTGSDRKEEDTTSEDENILTANDDDLDNAIAMERRITAEKADREEENENMPEMNYTEVVKKKKKYMVIKEAKTDDDVKIRVQLDQGPLAEQISRQRRVTFNFAEGSKNQNEEDIISAIKKKMLEESGQEPTDEEIKNQIRFIDRRTSLVFTKPGVDANSVGAKVNLVQPSKPRLSVPTIKLNITPGVKGTVGVSNLNLPSRENSALASSSPSPRNRDLSSSAEEKDSESNTDSSQQQQISASLSQPGQQTETADFSPPKIRKTQSLVGSDSEQFPFLSSPQQDSNPENISATGAKPGVGVQPGAVGVVGVGAKPGVGIQPGAVGVGVQPGAVGAVGVSGTPGIGAKPGVGVQPGAVGAVGVGSSPIVGVQPGTINIRASMGAIPGIGIQPGAVGAVGSGIGASQSVGVGVGTLPGVGVGARPGVGAGTLPGVGVGAGAGVGLRTLPGVGATPGVGVQPGTVGVRSSIGVTPGVGIQPGTVGAQIGATPGVGVQPGTIGVPNLTINPPPLLGVSSSSSSIGANPTNLPGQSTLGIPSLNPNLARQKRMTQPALNPTNQPTQPINQPLSGSNSPRYIPGMPNPLDNPLRQSTQPNQPMFKFSSESGLPSEQLDEESSSMMNQALREQILHKQQQIQQQQAQLQNRNIGQMQIRLPPNVTSVTASTNPNFNVPIISGLPNGQNFSTSGSVSPRSPTTGSFRSTSGHHTESANEVSDELSTASFESPRNNSIPTPNGESVPKSPFVVPGLSPQLQQHAQQYTTTRRRSSMVNVPVENLPTEIQQKIAENNNGNVETKNIDVEYEYEYEYEEYDENNEAKNAEEEKRKAEKLAAEERKMASNLSYCLHVVITHQWHIMSNPPKFAPDRAYPSQVFPIFATILHTRILRSDKTIKPQMRQQHQINFDKCLQIFATDMTKMPATHGDLFLTILLIILLIRTQAPRYRLDRKRCETALKTIQHTFESALLLILERSLDKAEVYVELFSEANFNQQKLLSDFHEIFDANKTAFVFGEVINNFLITRFTELLEGKMLNRIIAKPDKFTFGNAVKWNSFLTAFENDNNIQMKTIHQAVNVFIMIESISKTPSLASEVCPDITPALVSFFITHFKKDENIQNLPKPAKFNKEFKLNKAPKVFDHVPAKKTALTITTVKQQFTLDNWNDVAADEPNVKAFSFLSKYIKGNEQLYPPSALSTQDVS